LMAKSRVRPTSSGVGAISAELVGSSVRRKSCKENERENLSTFTTGCD